MTQYGDALPAGYAMEAERFLDSQDHVLSRVRYALGAKCFRQTRAETLLVRCLYIAGKYRMRS